jgi:hypothetical protein
MTKYNAGDLVTIKLDVTDAMHLNNGNKLTTFHNQIVSHTPASKTTREQFEELRHRFDKGGGVDVRATLLSLLDILIEAER